MPPPPILLYVGHVPFELVVGIWLLVKGSPGRPVEHSPTGDERLVNNGAQVGWRR
jgi:hypothetical protein